MALLNLSPQATRSLKRFKANKRGMWSLWLFSILFIISLGAEFIANDKPLLIKANNEYFFPVFKNYTETDFGGSFEAPADYHDSYLQELITQEGQGYIIWPLIPYSYNSIDYSVQTSHPSPPSAQHWLGTDDRGRDVLARALYGFRISVLFGLILTILSSVIGVVAGAIQGYFGGLTDLLFQRFIEIWSGLPVLYLLIIISSLLAPSFWVLLTLMLLFSWMALVGVVRAEFFKVRNFDYVRAAKGLGASHFTIITRHILPNACVATITFLPFVLNGAIITLTSLDFLGFGLPSGAPSLGELVAQGKTNLHAPWLGITAFMVLAILLSLLVFIGEAVRDAFDPRRTTS